MKHLILSLLILLPFVTNAQKDVTKFLGIPVDGTKSEMIKKLKAKGFKSTFYDKEILEGEFNGSEVTIHVVTNNNKVYRIVVADQTHRDETDIRIRFNKLCEQFENSPKYQAIYENSRISESEDISYETLINNKRYGAIYYQIPENLDRDSLPSKLLNICSKKYALEQLANPTPEIEADLDNITKDYMIDLYSKKPVWFIISEQYGKYYIVMYYDNEYNKANGEDL